MKTQLSSPSFRVVKLAQKDGYSPRRNIFLGDVLVGQMVRINSTTIEWRTANEAGDSRSFSAALASVVEVVSTAARASLPLPHKHSIARANRLAASAGAL